MKTTIPDNIRRITILDISGTYSSILNESYVDEETENAIREQYADASKYIVLRTL